MATITAATSGLASAGGTWVGGIAPVEGDKVVIPHTGTAFAQFTTDTAGYAIGATAITLTGSVAAGSFVIGETVRFGTDINNYTVTNWNSGTKVLTVTALIVAIPAAATTVYNDGFMVVLDGTYIWGDDSSTAIQLQGRLSASRTVNNSLTVKGTLTSTATTWPNGVWMDRGYEADPIPSGVTSTLIYNYSASMSTNKYAINWQWGWRWTEWGDDSKTLYTRLNGAVSASATSMVVDAATGWANNDYIVIADTGTGSSYSGDIKQITSVAGTTIGFSALNFAHADRAVVGNFTRNVITKPYSSSNPFQFRINLTSLGVLSTGTEGRYEFGYSSFENLGVSSSSTDAWVIDVRDEQLATAPVLRKMEGCAHYITSLVSGTALGNLSFANTVGVYNPYPISNVLVAANTSNAQTGRAGLRANLASIDVTDSWVLAGSSCISFIGCPYSTWTGGGASSGGSNVLYLSQCANTTITNADIGAGAYIGSEGSYDNVTIDNCRLGTGTGNGAISRSVGANFNLFGSGFYSKGLTVVDCDILPDPYTESQLALTPWYVSPADGLIKFHRLNSSTVYEWKRKNGTMYNSSTNNRSDQSIKFAQSSNLGAQGLYYEFPIAVVASTTYTVKGYLRKNASYGSTNRPTATLSGQGGATSSFTMTDSTDTWEIFTLSITPTTTGNATLKIQGFSTSASAVFYLDGFTFPPFNTYSRHYGYEFNTNSYVTANPYITETTEATVGAYTGISINHTTDTITVTSNHSIEELYDYCYYNLCQTTNLAEAEFFTTSDGINFSCSYNMVFTNANLTGTGAITITGGKTLTMNGTSQSSIYILHTNGTEAWTAISFTNIVAGSTLEIYNSTTTTQLYVGTPGTSKEYQLNYTADQTIRYRVSYQSGVTAKKFIELTGTFTISGLSIQINQEDDLVYIANAVDGSTITGITITPSPARVKINLAGGTIPWKNIYAYQVYWLTTTTGIADEAAFIEAVDTANYILTGFDIRNDSTTPLTITGGWGKDSVTNTIAGVIDVAGSVGNIYAEPDHIIPYGREGLTLSQFLALK